MKNADQAKTVIPIDIEAYRAELFFELVFAIRKKDRHYWLSHSLENQL
jgi:hypothetical protein